MADTTQDFDSIYHRLFSHPQMVVDLLRGFLDAAMLAELDLSQLRRHNSKFTARKGQRRRSDVVWEIPTLSGSSLFVLLILEFQSEVEEWMALRIDVYTGLLYQQLVDERKLKEKDGLPPVLPIVLYNGSPRWHAATALQDLIRLPEGSSLWKFQPEMRYYVIDEGSYASQVLQQSPCLTAIFFRMEQANPDDMVGAIRDLSLWFERNPDGPPVKQLFIELLLAGLTRLKVSPLPAIPEDLEEVVIMLASSFEQWALDHEKKGQLEGERTGRLEGERIGRQATLLRLLGSLFGTLPAWVEPMIVAARIEELECWTDRILKATTLEDVFGPPLLQ